MPGLSRTDFAVLSYVYGPGRYAQGTAEERPLVAQFWPALRR